MIIEGLVTTLAPAGPQAGEPHVAPMGPETDPSLERLILKPFRTSQTLQNLRAHPEGVFHIVDDVELIARAVLGQARPAARPADRVRGFVLLDACRYFEFRVELIDETEERARIDCAVVASGRLRDFLGFNRAKSAVVEAAILASRASFLPLDRLRAQLAGLAEPVRKTGGAAEHRAFELLAAHVEGIARSRERGLAPGAAPAAVRVRTASRLHFGLLSPADSGPRRFGGVGAMVRDPGLELVALPAREPAGAGPLAARAAEMARRVRDAGGGPSARVEVRRAPPEHAGLGTGTQLGMAVARALSELAGERDVPARELARRSGRGERSGVGLHGFERGGLLVDGGRGPSSGPAPLVARVEIPAEWRFVLFLPRSPAAFPRERPAGLSGPVEREAFRRLDAAPELAREMAHAVLLGLLPAAMERDLTMFGEALDRLERAAAACFAPVQGGPYASQDLGEVVRFVRGEGFPGAGQSSWGPTLYAVAADEERAGELARRVAERFPHAGLEPVISAPANSGASVEAVPDPSAASG